MSFGPRFASIQEGELRVFDDDTMVQEYTESRLRELNARAGDNEYGSHVQRIVLELILKGRLTTQVFTKLHDQYPLNYSSLLCIATWLPTAFSQMKWKDVSEKFKNLLTAFSDTRRRISSF